MKIIVVAENLGQFYAYVYAMLKCDIGSIITTNTKCACRCKLCRVKSVSFPHTVTIEELSFVFCNDPLRLKGMTFGENDRLERVGTWYNLSAETLNGITTEFMTRIKK